MTTSNSELERKQKLKEDFCSEVSSHISPDNFKGTSLYSFIRNRSRNWHISHVDPNDIIIEGVKRGIEYIEKTGKAIEKPESWLRKVCMNILSDTVEQAIKEEKKIEGQKALLREMDRASESQPDLVDYLEFIDEALSSLSKNDQFLLKMRFLKGKSYEQIRHIYELQGEVVTVPALRKRESRAVQRLRKNFRRIHHENQ
jgi:RNA polymerase sigma factor (sigma-70 family)